MFGIVVIPRNLGHVPFLDPGNMDLAFGNSRTNPGVARTRPFVVSRSPKLRGLT